MKYSKYITQKELKATFYYNPMTGIFIWKKRNCQRRRIGDIAGSIRKNGYCVITVNSQLYLAHRLAWLYIYGEWPEFEIDHRNMNPTDNRIKNLRKATPAQNKWNTKAKKNNKLGIKGVSLDKRNNKYQAVFVRNGQRIHLGHFNTPEEAAKVYNEVIKKRDDKFSRVS